MTREGIAPIEAPIANADHLRRAFYECSLDYEVVGSPRDSAASLYREHFGGIDVLRYESLGVRGARRSPHHIRSDQVDDFLISLPLHAPLILSQCGRRTRVTQGGFVFMATGKPFESMGEADSSKPFAELIVRISGPLLRGRVLNIDDCCNRPIAIRSGAGRIMYSLLDLALHEGRELSAEQKRTFCGTLLDAIASATLEAPELSSLANQPRLTATEHIRANALAYINEHLSNPELDVREIADHCGVSIRYLHVAFAETPLTVGNAIREMRLQSCQMALRSDALSNRTITEIAMMWGFNDYGHFSRLYRARFGATAGSVRKFTRTDKQ